MSWRIALRGSLAKMQSSMAPLSNAKNTSPGLALLPRWANGQDGWVRAIVTDVLANRIQASNTDIDRYLKLLLAEKKLSAEQFEPVPQLEEKELDTAPLDPVKLDSLKIGDGINALKAGAQIDFAPGVTVIFGENGSGKSGFVRVLKRAAGLRTAEDILHNVRTGQKPSPSATFEVTIGSASRSITWSNDFGVPPMNRVSIFDTRGARLHVEDDLTYVYTPGELTLFPLIQNVIERVRTQFEATISSRGPGPNMLVASFERSSSMYATMETLGAATDLEEIRSFAVVPDNVEIAIESLKVEVDALKSMNIQNELKRARDRAGIVTGLRDAFSVAISFETTKYDDLVRIRADAEEAHDNAGAKAFDGLGIPGILGPEWRQFVQAAEEYLQETTNASYPAADDTCAYCQQPLTAKAIDLIKKYRAFSNDQVKQALDAAEVALAEYIGPFVDVDLEGLGKRLETEINGGPDVLSAVRDALAVLSSMQLAVSGHKPVAWPNKDQSLTSAVAVVHGEESRLTGLVAGLQSSVAERQTALKAKQVELAELQAKKTAKALLPQIEKRVADAKWVGRANIVKNNLSGVLRTLTEAAKNASEELLNNDFARRFEAECKRLRAPNVTLNFPGRQGQVTRRKLVSSYKPSQVLSEGEQKALALADFMAEVTAVPSSSPVVFDDPITSMDYRRIHEVCDRILDLASDHQVIIFTHNIWFAAELLGKANKKTLKYYDIALEGAEAGIVTAGTHPRVDTVAQVMAAVRQLIDAAEKQTGEIRAAIVEKGYERLRNLAEIVVEQELFKGVVQRYAPNVMMTKLEKVNSDKLTDSVAVIAPIFEKCCRYIASHSQPIETQGIRPTLDELKVDFKAVLDAREPHKG